MAPGDGPIASALNGGGSETTYRTSCSGPLLVATVPMARLGLSEELASAIVFIASDEASFITGHVLNVDGGKSH
jgi:NAD(P)-dependent dehydrogenase (short-subunit alcohol dehydrogenase family)